MPGHTAGREQLHGLVAKLQAGGHVGGGQHAGQQGNVVVGAVAEHIQRGAGGQQELCTGVQSSLAAVHGNGGAGTYGAAIAEMGAQHRNLFQSVGAVQCHLKEGSTTLHGSFGVIDGLFQRNVPQDGQQRVFGNQIISVHTEKLLSANNETGGFRGSTVSDGSAGEGSFHLDGVGVALHVAGGLGGKGTADGTHAPGGDHVPTL